MKTIILLISLVFSGSVFAQKQIDKSLDFVRVETSSGNFQGIQKTIPTSEPCYVLPEVDSENFHCPATKDWGQPFAYSTCSFSYLVRKKQDVTYLFFDRAGSLETSVDSVLATDTFHKFSARGSSEDHGTTDERKDQAVQEAKGKLVVAIESFRKSFIVFECTE